MRISELADEAGVPVSTIRYYERIGLLAEPARTGSGYREYDNDSATLATAFSNIGVGWAANVIAIGALAGLTTVVLVLLSAAGVGWA